MENRSDSDELFDNPAKEALSEADKASARGLEAALSGPDEAGAEKSRHGPNCVVGWA